MTLSHVIILISLACISVQAAEVRHIEADGAHLVDVSNSNYALTSPALEANGWKTVSVNGDNFVGRSSSCQVIAKPFSQLTDSERNNISSTRSSLADLANQGARTNQPFRFSFSVFPLTGSEMRISVTKNTRSSSSQINGFSMTKSDEDNFSLSKPNMPNNLARIFATKETVTFVYLDSRVIMEPMGCLSAEERQLFEGLKMEMIATEKKMREDMNQNMKNMQQNMQQNMMNMQQNMQNMQQNMQTNMNNMFGNGFPFSSGARANSGDISYSYYGNQPYAQMQEQVQPRSSQSYSQTSNYLNPMNEQNQGYNWFNGLNPMNGYRNTRSADTYSAAYSGNMQNSYSPFGNNFPFGPNNSPFGAGFPFGG